MNVLIPWLEQLGQENRKVRAVLRRSLAQAPGEHVPAFPYVEPFLSSDTTAWRRQMHYLVAGLWASHWREGRTSAPLSIGHACRNHWQQSESNSTERRFIALLDADSQQLPHRLRQMVSLLKEYPLDFDALLTGLVYWNNERKTTQNRWARDFYHVSHGRGERETTDQQESA